MDLLSVSADAKTRKGESKGYLTGILYLAPYTSGGGKNLCPNASPECVALCLNTAGRGVFDSVQAGRRRKTREFFADRKAFVARLVAEVGALARKARRLGMVPLIRLNGTSDIGWEAFGIMDAHPDVQFYDYTKSPARMRRWLDGKLPSNYHLTFSRSECNDAAALDVLARGGNVAVVFATKRGAPLPAAWRGYPVIDGDVSDVRPDDPGAFNPANGAASMGARGVVVGLRAKGRARAHVGGFVVAVA